MGLGFDALSDLDQSVIRSYHLSFDLSEPLRPAYAERGFDLTEQNADGSWSLPVPATFVLDTTGTVRARHVDANYRVRMDPTELLDALLSLH
jgi:peroxiredoxin